MGQIVVPGQYSGRNYGFTIAGDTPTVEEKRLMDGYLRKYEADFFQEYEAQVGTPVDTGEGEGILNYAGELPKGIVRGGLGMLEKATVGALEPIPGAVGDWAQEKARELGYWSASNLQPDYGYDEGTVAGKLGEGLGSFAPLIAAAFVNPLLGYGLSTAAGVGTVGENARRVGEDPTVPALLGGAAIGASEMLVPSFMKALGPSSWGRAVSFVRNVAISAGEEAAQEAAAEVGYNFLQQIPDPDQELLEGVGESAGYGGAVGAIMQALLQAAMPGKVVGGDTTPDMPAPGMPTSEVQGPLNEVQGPLQPAQGPEPAIARVPTTTLPPQGTKQTPQEADLSGIAGLPIDPTRRPELELPGYETSVDPQVMDALDAWVDPTDINPYIADPEYVYGAPSSNQSLAVTGLAPDLFDPTLGSPSGVSPSEALRNIGVIMPETAPMEPTVKEPTAKEQADARYAAIEELDVLDQIEEHTAEGLTPVQVVQQLGDKLDTLGDAKAKRAAVHTAQQRLGLPRLKVDRPAWMEEAKKRIQERNADLSSEEQAAMKEAAAASLDVGPVETPTTEAKAPIAEETPSAEPAAYKEAQPKNEGGLDDATGELVQPDSAVPVDTPRVADAYTDGVGDGPEAGGRPDAEQVSGGAEPGPGAVGGREVVPDAVDSGATPQPAPVVPTRVAPSRGPGTPDAAEYNAAGQGRATSNIVTPNRPMFEGIPADPAPAEKTMPTDPTDVFYGPPEMQDMQVQETLEEQDTNRRLADRLAHRFETELDAPTRDYVNFSFIAAYNEDGSSKINDVTTAADKRAILALKKTKNSAAHRYFAKFPTVMEALQNIAHDAATMTTPYRRGDLAITPETIANPGKYPNQTKTLQALKANVRAMTDGQLADNDPEFKRLVAIAIARSEEQHAFYKQTGGKHSQQALDWTQNNLSPLAASYVSQMYVQAKADASRGLNYMSADKQNQMRATEEFFKDLEKEGAAEAVFKENKRTKFHDRKPADMYRDVLLPLDMQQAAQRGDLFSVMSYIASAHPSMDMRKLAQALKPHIGRTKLRVYGKNFNPEKYGTYFNPADPAMGTYAIDENMIVLNDDLGMDAETLVHELVHAATHETLKNPMHPLTKQLTKLWEETRDDIRSWAGNEGAIPNVDEFAAEVFSNVEMRQLLASMYNGKTTALTRFKRIVGNFVRRLMGKPTDPDLFARSSGVLTEADMLIERILAPAPETSGDGSLHQLNRMSPEKKRVVLRNVNRMAAEWKPQYKDGFMAMLSGYTPEWVKSVSLKFLELQAFAEIAKKYLPSVVQVNDLVREESGRASEMNGKIEPVIQQVARFTKRNSEATYQMFLDLMNQSTIAKVDPTLNQQAARKKYGKDADMWSEYVRLREMHDTLKNIDPAGIELYGKVRNIYLDLHQQLKQALMVRLESVIEDTKTRETMVQKLYSEIMDKGIIDPYFSLMRTGDYWISYTDVDPRTGTKEMYVTAFKTDRQRSAAVRKLQARGATDISIKPTRTDARKDFNKAPPNSFVYGVLRTLDTHIAEGETDEGGVSEGTKAKEAIMDLFLDNMPESSFLQGYRHREGTAGYDGGVTPLSHGEKPVNFAHLLYNKTMSLTHQITTMEYNAKFDQLSRKIEEEAQNELAKQSGDTRLQMATSRLHTEIQERIAFAKSPHYAKWAKAMRMGAFHWTIGGWNVSSAAVNMFQLPGVVGPYLAAEYGYKNTAKAMGNATKLFMNTGRDGFKWKREVETYSDQRDANGDPIMVKTDVGAFASIDNMDFNHKDTPEHLRYIRHLVDVASEFGQLHRTIAYDTLDMHFSDDLMSKANAVSGFVFHHSERMNRQISMLTTYDLKYHALQKQVREKYNRDVTTEEARALAKEALALTDRTNGSVAAASAPSIAHSNAGAVLYMFKRFGGAMYWHLFKMTADSINSVDTSNMTEQQLLDHKKMKAVVRQQLAATFGSTAMLAGVQGLPGFALVALIYNMFHDDDEETFEERTRRSLGETPYSGLVNAVAGIEVSSRVGLNNLIFRPALYEKDQSLLWTAAEQLGGPVIGVSVNALRGAEDVLAGEGNAYRGWEALMPASVRNVMKTARFASEGVVTRRGDTVIDDIGFGHLLGQALGFAPAEYIEAMQLNAALKRMDIAAGTKRSFLTKKLYMAQRQGDTGEMEKIFKEIAEFNEKFPEWALDMGSIAKSLKQHSKTSSEMFQGISLNSKLMRRWMEIAEAWD